MSPWARFCSTHALLAVLSIPLAGPLLWMVSTSLKSETEIAADPHRLLPESPRWQNYADATRVFPLRGALAASLFYGLGSAAGAVVSCSLAAYAFALLRWPGRGVAFGLVLTTMLLPWQATMIPRFLLIRELGLYDSLWALVAPHFLGDAFSIFLLRQFFLSAPRELLEAARVDGCGDWGVFWRVLLPISRPALATVALLQSVAAWNDYGGPLLYLSDPAKFPLAYALEQFTSSHSSEPTLLMAAATLFALPVLLLFLLTQQTFLKGIASSGIKG